MADDSTNRPSGVRPEIQALRAVAVLVVVIYHLWPARLPGGFVGVDVFFAISGFLITAHLLREVTATGRVGLTAFWARRIRRLLPASLLVVVASAIGTLVWVPVELWKQFFGEIAAATLYLENWMLAANSVDYLAIDNVASPVQHFWSLSAEEQFYIVWPLLILLAALLTRRSSARRRLIAVGVVLGLVTASSLVLSIVQTATEPATAYFVTYTRAWEFGLGGLLALALSRSPSSRPRLRTILSVAGWGAIAFTAVTYSDATPFPGAAAAVPVLGTLAVIAAGSSAIRWSPTAALSWRPVQFVGDISYSIYLWHWPLIVFYPYIFGVERSNTANVAILVLALLLGWGSKSWVEDPVRRGALARARPWRSILAMAVVMAVLVSGASFGTAAIDRQAEADARLAVELLDKGTPCFGAASMDPKLAPCDNPELDGLVVPSVIGSQATSSSTWTKCASKGTTPGDCTFGVPGGTRVALIGDSHANQWLGALERVALSEGWELHLFVKGGCVFSHAARQRDTEQASDSCAGWNKELDQTLASDEPYTYVFTSMRAEIFQKIATTDGADARETAIAGFHAAWQPLIDRGTTVVGVKDVRDADPKARDCISQHMDDLTQCELAESVALRHTDYLADAAATLPGAVVVDLTDYFCANGSCPSVIGGVLVFRDGDHITGTYARTLAPYLLAELETQLQQSR